MFFKDEGNDGGLYSEATQNAAPTTSTADKVLGGIGKVAGAVNPILGGVMGAVQLFRGMAQQNKLEQRMRHVNARKEWANGIREQQTQPDIGDLMLQARELY